MNELSLAYPEIFVLSMACLILLLDLYLPKGLRILTYFLTQVTLLIGMLLCMEFPHGDEVIGFHGHFAADALAQTLKAFMLGIVFVVLLYSRSYVRERNIARGEYHLLVLFSTLGMMFLVSAKTTLMIFLGLELFSLPVYTLVALHRDSSKATEAGMKYFITGALASGMLLYGLSVLYGLTGTLEIDATATAIAKMQDTQQLTLLVFGLVFVVAGIAFKFGAVPFHMWLPDVYDGAPTSVTLLIGTAPKVAAFGMTYRLLMEAAPQLSLEWGQFLIVLAVLSLAAGNIIAIAQTNIKRMLAYSTIAHVGFILLGFVAGGEAGFQASMFYVLVYALLAAGAFGVIILLSQKGFEAENIADFKGLAQRSPWVAFIMLLILFSLTGVPPTAGFYAKFIILNALVDAELTWLAAVAVFFSIIGAFYYLRVIKVMYFDTVETPKPLTGAMDMRLVLSLNGVAVLLLGIFPAPLFMICQQAVG